MGWVEDLRTNVVQLIFSITEITTIIANQNAPRPKEDYITVLLTTSAKPGQEQFTQADDNGDITKASDRDISISLQCISENGMQILEDLKHDIKSQANLQLLRDNGLAYVNTGDVLDITAALGDNDMESRAAMDLFLRTAVVSIENVGIVENISGTGTLVKDDGSTIEQDIPVT